MSIDDLINAFGSIFTSLWTLKLLGIPILFWFVMIAIFAIIGGFIKGKK